VQSVARQSPVLASQVWSVAQALPARQSGMQRRSGSPVQLHGLLIVWQTWPEGQSLDIMQATSGSKHAPQHGGGGSPGARHCTGIEPPQSLSRRHVGVGGGGGSYPGQPSHTMIPQVQPCVGSGSGSYRHPIGGASHSIPSHDPASEQTIVPQLHPPPGGGS